MPTEVYSNSLEVFLEADSHAGANGANVSQLDDNSGNNRDFTASANYPTVKTGAVNGKKSIVFNNSNPLVWSGASFPLACGFLVAKINALDNYDGFLTDASTNPFLVGNPGNNQFWNHFTPNFEIRVNDRIHRLTDEIDENPPILIGEFAIYFFNRWKPISVSSLQIGQDRADTSRRANMEFAALALYSNYHLSGGNKQGEQARRQMMESFAWSYQIPIEDVFPYHASNTDTGERRAFVLSDGQPVPIVAQKSSPFYTYECTFNNRRYTEYEKAEDYFDARAYTGKTFFFRFFKGLAYDKIVRFDESANFQDRGNLVNGARRNYAFSIIETNKLPAKYIPGKPNFSGVPIVDTIPPSNVTNLAADAIKPNQIDLSWDAATDNIGVEGYRIQRALSNTFPLSHDTVTFDVGNVTEYEDKTASANTEYFYRIKARDAQPNYSSNWSNIANATTPAIPDEEIPTVTLSAPPSTVSGTVTLNAAATDNVAVQRVDFYITPQSGSPSRYLGSKIIPTPAPSVSAAFDWNTTVDGLGNPIANGVYTLSAISYDTAGLMSSPSFRPNITVANNVNANPVMNSLTTAPGDGEITGTGTFADSDGTVEEVYLEVSDTGANQNSPKGVGWETVLDGVAPDTATAHQFVVTEFDGTPLGDGETLHFRMWVVDNDGGISGRRFTTGATNPPVGGSDNFLQDDDGELLFDDEGNQLEQEPD